MVVNNQLEYTEFSSINTHDITVIADEESVSFLRGANKCLVTLASLKLANYIKSYTLVHRMENTDEPAMIYPEHYTILSFYCGPEEPFAYFLGLWSKPFDFLSIRPGTYFSIIFKPATMYALTSIPLSEFNNRIVYLDEILPRTSSFLIDKISNATTFREKIKVWEQWFSLILNKKCNEQPIWLSNLVIEMHENASDANFFKTATSYSDRYIRKLFSKYVGASPKVTHKVARHKCALYNLHFFDDINYSDLSIKLGYYDQAHFINDFKQLQGSLPTTYLDLIPSFKCNKR